MLIDIKDGMRPCVVLNNGEVKVGDLYCEHLCFHNISIEGTKVKCKGDWNRKLVKKQLSDK